MKDDPCVINCRGVPCPGRFTPAAHILYLLGIHRRVYLLTLLVVYTGLL
jgi:hypothetical protein